MTLGCTQQTRGHLSNFFFLNTGELLSSYYLWSFKYANHFTSQIRRVPLYRNLKATESEFTEGITELCNISSGEGLIRSSNPAPCSSQSQTKRLKPQSRCPLDLEGVVSWALPCKACCTQFQGQTMLRMRNPVLNSYLASLGATSFHFLVFCWFTRDISPCPSTFPHQEGVGHEVLSQPSFLQSEEAFVKFHTVGGCLTLYPI